MSSYKDVIGLYIFTVFPPLEKLSGSPLMLYRGGHINYFSMLSTFESFIIIQDKPVSFFGVIPLRTFVLLPLNAVTVN